jgi:hypothetical protein
MYFNPVLNAFTGGLDTIFKEKRENKSGCQESLFMEA